MPYLHTRKDFQPNSFYHVYNRGTHQTNIFRQPKDYWRFRNIIRDQLRASPTIELKAFSLLENHFHLQIYQKEARDITKFMKLVQQRYVFFFNIKYRKKGGLFESCYKGRLLVDEKDVEYSKDYILNNPLDAGYMNWQHVGVEI